MPTEGESFRWFETEIRPHEPKLRAWLRNRFPSLSEIDDVIQEAYLRLFRRRSEGELMNSKAYLFATARNLTIDGFRKEAKIVREELADFNRQSVLEETTPASDAADLEDRMEILIEAIQALPDRCREILLLRRHSGLSHRAIASRLGISPHTVNAQLTIAMEKCRAHFRARGILG